MRALRESPALVVALCRAAAVAAGVVEDNRRRGGEASIDSAISLLLLGVNGSRRQLENIRPIVYAAII